MTIDELGDSALGTLRHEALFYTGEDDYLLCVQSFVDDAVAAGEPVLIAVPGHRLELLRPGFGSRTDVRLVDMARAGRNPSWIIPGVLDAFVSEHPGTRVRIVGEPIWPGRSALAYPRCVQGEALINVALAKHPATILCPYDAGRLDSDTIADAASTHPVLVRDGERRVSAGYGSPEAVVDAFNRPFPDPPPAHSTLIFEASGLSGMRALVAALASQAGLDPDQISDLQIATNEIATNAVTHADGPAVLRVWAEPDGMVCEVIGSSVLTDRLAGLIPPPPTTDRGRGLLLANFLCDLVEVHTDDRSTTVRLHMSR
jgi:anti-sigma regulatory factor (Ser/Thr protein kinase)